MEEDWIAVTRSSRHPLAGSEKGTLDAMSHLIHVSPALPSGRFWPAVLLLLLSSALWSCQLSIKLPDLSNREARAAQSAIPTVSPTPTTAITTIQGAKEIEAASRVIPVPKNSAPKGPRKQPATRLIIPAIDVDTKVIELNTRYDDQGELVWETAPFAAGHHVGTANPGEQGNVVISGHISSTKEGAVFKRLPEIKVGDGIVVVTSERDYLYRVVDNRVVEPTQVEVMGSTPEEVLTLITCVPDGIYSQRLVVTANRV